MFRPALALKTWVATFALLCMAVGASAREIAPSQPGVDAPELAKLGAYAVGVRTLVFTQTGQPNVLAPVSATGTLPLQDRVLTVDIWYPAHPAKGAKPASYTDVLPAEPPHPPVRFTTLGLAVRNAPATGGSFPLVIVSHGYSGTPAGMSWLTENLASKGYVVAAIHHRDPDYSSRDQFVEPLMRRPLDIAFVARQLLASKDPALVAADKVRLALVGYSMGGYGVLTAAGAGLDAMGGPATSVPGGAMKPFVRGAVRAADIRVPGVRAVVAIAPAGTGFNAWGASGLADITAPLLIIGGDRDRTVGFPNGIRPIFDQAKGSDRYLLVFQNGGHAIGMTGAPSTMRSALWDLDWFEDPVWGHDRIMAIEQHMITAFLDRFVKGDESRASYLDTDVAVSNAAVWPKDGPAKGYDVISPGGPGATWKGFRKNHSDGLELHHKAAGT